MSMTLSTVVFFGYTWGMGAYLELDPQSYQPCGENGLLEWRSFGYFDTAGSARFLGVTSTIIQTWDGQPVVVPALFPSAQIEWRRLLDEYLESVEVPIPGAEPAWWAVSSYG